MKGVSRWHYRPLKILLDLSVELLMFGKVIVEGLGSTNVDLESCPCHILTSMGGSKWAWGLTKHEVVIQINLCKAVDYTTV